MTNVAVQVRRDIEARLRELRPLVEEARQLEALLAQWDRGLPREQTRASASAAAASPRRSPGQGGQRRPVAARQAEILAVLNRRPGIDTKGLAQAVGLSRPRLSQLLGPLEQAGRVTRAHGGLFPAPGGDE